MATSQDLVPVGQEQGARQRNVAAMKAAGVPLSSEGGGDQGSPSPTIGAGPPPRVPAAPVNRGDLSQFDVFQAREPTEGFTATPQRQVMFEQVRQSPNQVMQSIFNRMRGYKED